MANNIIFEDFEDQLSVECTQPATPASGDPILFGDRAGVALTAERSDGRTTVLFECVAELNVNGVDGSGNSAVKAGDVLYYTAADTIKISKKATGVRYGVATSRPSDTAGANLIAGGANATIRVYVGL
jgi:predicted RecA/RadA family phage recombinase